MNFEEFLQGDTNEASPEEVNVEENADEISPVELDVQKAVVESLAADKAEQEEELRRLRSDLAIKDAQIKAENVMKQSLYKDIEQLKAKVAELEQRLADEQNRKIDMQARNPNALALLDRDVELPDRFPGETRDHVLEVIQAARAKAESEGRLRRAQILESVLVANEPNGSLAEHRAEIEKIFEKNAHVINGTVIEELTQRGISHKNGEEYLLPDEIIKRNF